MQPFHNPIRKGLPTIHELAALWDCKVRGDTGLRCLGGCDQPHEFNNSYTVESKLRPDLLNLGKDRFERWGLRKKDFCFPFVVSLELGERFANL